MHHPHLKYRATDSNLMSRSCLIKATDSKHWVCVCVWRWGGSTTTSKSSISHATYSSPREFHTSIDLKGLDRVKNRRMRYRHSGKQWLTSMSLPSHLSNGSKSCNRLLLGSTATSPLPPPLGAW